MPHNNDNMIIFDVVYLKKKNIKMGIKYKDVDTRKAGNPALNTF